MAEYASVKKKAPYKVRVLVEDIRITIPTIDQIKRIAAEIGLSNVTGFKYDSDTRVLEYQVGSIASDDYEYYNPKKYTQF